MTVGAIGGVLGAIGGTLDAPPAGGASSYAELLSNLGAARYWDLAETSGNFQPVIGSDVLTIGNNVTRGTSGPLGTGDGTMAMVSSGLHTTPKAELGTTSWTVAIWVYGASTSYRTIVGGGGTFRVWYMQDKQLRPYGFSFNAKVGPVLSANRWYLVTIGSDATSGVKYWLDGAQEYTHATPVACTTDATVAHWGTNTNGAEHYERAMAHPATWDRLLTNSEVAQLWDYVTG